MLIFKGPLKSQHPPTIPVGKGGCQVGGPAGATPPHSVAAEMLHHVAA